MRSSIQLWFWWLTGCLAMGLVLAHFGQPVAPAVAATPPCPEGSAPVEFARLAIFNMPSDLPEGAEIQMARITLSPGQVMETESEGYTAYFVESGVLKFLLPPRQKGFHLEHPAQCVSASGEFSSGGTNSVDEEGWLHVDAGTAVISEEIPIEQIGNAGSTPLELLQVMLIFPEIDPATGQPIGDELVTDRGNRERQKQRQEHRDATPTP